MKKMKLLLFSFAICTSLIAQDSLFTVTHQNPDANDPVSWEILSQQPNGSFFIQPWDEFTAVVYTNDPNLLAGNYVITIRTTDTRTDPGPLTDTKEFTYKHLTDDLIDVISPDGGEVFHIGDPVIIRWNYSEWVHLELYKGGTWYNTIKDSIKTGVYSWLTSSFFVAQGSDYEIKVKEWGGDNSGYSEGYFTLLNNFDACDTIPITLIDSVWSIIQIDTTFGWIYTENQYLLIPEPIECIYNDTIPIPLR